MRRTGPLPGVVIRAAFYCEVGLRVLANAVLLLLRLVAVLLDSRPKDTDLLTGLLALVHLLMLLTMGLTAVDTFTPQGGLWDDLTCKAVVHLYRVMRGLSISATCLLSILQAVTLSPRSSCLAKFRPQSPGDSLRALLFLWVLYMSFSAHFSISAVTNSTVASQGLTFLSDSCAILPLSHLLRQVFSVLGAFRDVFLLGLMALSSGSMVALLCRHQRQCQHLHGSSLSPRPSPELRATRTVLLLTGCFVLTYCLDCVVSSSRTTWNNDPVCHSVQTMVANGYATTSPLVFLWTAKQGLNLLKCLWGGQ